MNCLQASWSCSEALHWSAPLLSLIHILEFEKYTKDEAEYGADNCGADWKEQAAKSAESYLEFSSFSKDGLIKQLEFEGYTEEEAVYGAEANGF